MVLPMGLEAVVSEIDEKGRREAERIKTEAEAEVKEILTAAQARAEEIKLAVEDDVQEKNSNILNQEVSSAGLFVKRELLNTQKQLLDQVYNDALASVAALQRDDHKKVLKDLLKKAAKEVKEGVVHCNERDMPAVKETLENLKTLKGLAPGEAVDIEGGIIVESSDGGLKIDYSYRMFLDRVWESGLGDVSGILFG